MTTQCRAEVPLSHLDSSNPQLILSALAAIRNDIIGSSSKKHIYHQLGIIPRVLSLMSSSNDFGEIRILAASVVASLAHSKQIDIAASLVESGAIDEFVLYIAPGSDDQIMVTALRALNALFSLKDIQYDSTDLFLGTMVQYLLGILSKVCDEMYVRSLSWRTRMELAALILAKICNTEARQMTVASMGAIPILVNLSRCDYVKLQVAGTRALGSLAYENGELSHKLLHFNEGGASLSERLLELVRSTDPAVRLSACVCLANICHMTDLSECFKRVTVAVVPALIKLIKYSDVDINMSVQTLGYICYDHEAMQLAAINNGALEALNKYIHKLDTEELEDEDDGFVDHDALSEKSKHILLTIGTITSSHEECRNRAASLGMIPTFIKKLSHRNPSIRMASCLCIRSLSRSTDMSRTKLPDAGVLAPLLKLLDDPAEDVQAMAIDTLTNFLQGNNNPIKTEAVERGVIDKLIKTFNSDNVPLSKKALFTLKNMMCNSEPTLKAHIMEAIGYDRIKQLIYGKDEEFQNLAAAVIRNMACNYKQDVDTVFVKYGEPEVTRIISHLTKSRSDAVLTDAFFIVTNITAVGEGYRQIIFRHREIVDAIVCNLSHVSTEVKIACRIRVLKELGIEEKLRQLENSHDLDLSDRAKATYAQILEFDMEHEGGELGEDMPVDS
ncbi:hypothetical protein EV182_002736 [Spiromyces aspiralis]|uniref:Uncharacterized protein n=1 Tax=Spiromyces aspiralis TaxID=68401 RepID=A0ACC1HDM9_9FUNG|nr:hypothetical protein EV182_002736 [Spiromyces aspiralis]